MQTKITKPLVTRKQRRAEMRAYRRRMLERARPHPSRVRQKYDAEMENGDGFNQKPKRYKRLSKRMQWMSQPKYQNQKYEAPNNEHLPKCTCAGATVRPLSSRLEHLSLPLVRTLKPAKQILKPVLSEGHFKNIKSHLTKSLNTIYSKIYNISSSKSAKKKRVKRDKEKLKQTEEWCKKNSQPKKYESELIFRLHQYTSLTEEDFARLSTPRHTVKPFQQRKLSRCSIPTAVLNFQVTPTLVALATPKPKKEPEDFEQYENPYDLPREYRKIKSVGYQNLATPKKSDKPPTKDDTDPFKISPNALKCKTTEETKKLAVPKPDQSEAPKVIAISKAALKKLKPDKEQYFAKLATPRQQQ